MTGPPQSPRPYHHGDLRAALLRAAREQLRAGGYEAVSLRELARTLGVTRSAPYFHFRNRDALLWALVVEGSVQLQRTYADAAALPGSPVDRLAAACRAYLDLAREEPELFRLMFASPLVRDPSFDDVVRRGPEMFERLVGDAMGPSDPLDVNAVAISCWSAMHGFAMLRLHERLGQFIAPEQTEEQVIRAALRQVCDD